MPVIEGIGDEILQFFGCVSIILLVTIAWISTNVREVNSYRACLVSFAYWLRIRRLEETTERQLSPVTSTNNTSNTVQQRYDEEHIGVSYQTDTSTNGEENSNFSSASIPTTRQNSNENTPRQPEPMRDQNRFDPTREQTEQGTPRPSRNGAIIIKLKYLNESVKMVNGNLHEKLGDFKRRHFNTELSQGKRVMLLFNGNILDRDEQTLGHYGIFDNCAVHCLFRRRTAANTQAQRRPRRNRSEVDLFMIVFTSWGVMLIGIWFSRYRFTELFSATATTGLLMLSGLYLACLVGSIISQDVGLAPVQLNSGSG